MTVRDGEMSGCSASRLHHDAADAPVNGRRPVPDRRSAGGWRGRRRQRRQRSDGATGGRPQSAVPGRRTGGAGKRRCRRPEVAGIDNPLAEVESRLSEGQGGEPCRPAAFAPWLASKVTRWFSSSVRNPSLNGRVVDEDVRTVVVGRDEAEALLGVEPLQRCPRRPDLPHSRSGPDRHRAGRRRATPRGEGTFTSWSPLSLLHGRLAGDREDTTATAAEPITPRSQISAPVEEEISAGRRVRRRPCCPPSDR